MSSKEMSEDMKQHEFEGEEYINAKSEDDRQHISQEGKISDAFARQLEEHPLISDKPTLPPIDRQEHDEQKES